MNKCYACKKFSLVTEKMNNNKSIIINSYQKSLYKTLIKCSNCKQQQVHKWTCLWTQSWKCITPFQQLIKIKNIC